MYFSLVCVPYFLVYGVYFLQKRDFSVSYALELLSPAVVGVAGAAAAFWLMWVTFLTSVGKKFWCKVIYLTKL